MAIVHRVGNADQPERAGDVVFVHGLDGHWQNSWSRPGPDGFWPQWLAERFPRVGIWSVEYDAASTAWRGHAMPIIDRATNVLDDLLNRDIGQRPLVFVAHSMGGLIVKQLLRHAYDQRGSIASHGLFVDAVQGVFFLSTPHAGADLAYLGRYLQFFTRVTSALTDLTPNAAPLRDLNLWYRSLAPELDIATAVYFETRQTSGVRVVDETTADPGLRGVVPVGVDADHISICKPADRDGQVFLGCSRFLRERFQRGPVQLSSISEDNAGVERASYTQIAPRLSGLNEAEILRRHAKRTLVQRAMRVIPKHKFDESGWLGPQERDYVFVSDYDEQRLRSLNQILRCMAGSQVAQEITDENIDTEWIGLIFQVGTIYYSRLDLMPGTWKAVFRIISDTRRLGIVKASRQDIRNMRPRDQSAMLPGNVYRKNYYTDDQDYWRARVMDALSDAGCYAHRELERRFGWISSCFRGDGFMRSGEAPDGELIGRLFLVKNVQLSMTDFEVRDLGSERAGRVLS